MRFLNALLIGLLRLPFRVRLSMVVLCFLLCLILYFFSPFNGPLFAIPVALAVWLFKQRGAFMSIGLTALALAVANSMSSGGIFWPRPLLVGLITGTLALLTEGFFIFYLRYLLDMAEAARVRAVQAEQQRRIAYERQIEVLQAEERMILAYEQQQQLNHLKDLFIMGVNHELRTPLTALSGWLEVLGLAQAQLDSASQATYLRKAKESCEALMHLVNNVLDAASISSNMKPSQLEACLVVQVVCEELERFDPRETQDFAIQLDIPEQLTVWANQQYLRRVLRNLLSNAFKYAPKQTCVIISAVLKDTLEQGTSSAPHVSISVKDAGPGIPSAEQPLLFEKFVRLKRDLSVPVRGCGLGLYISKQLVEAMGGHIWVESSGRVGEGSRFCFTLPGAADTSLPARASDLSRATKVVSN